MEEPPLRIRVVFDDRKKLLSRSQRLEGLKQSWLLLTPEMATMADVASQLMERFRLKRSCPNGLLLYLDDFVLPPFESTCILKDQDVIRVGKKGASPTKLIEAPKNKQYDQDSEIMEREPISPGHGFLSIKEYEEDSDGGQKKDEEDSYPSEITNLKGKRKQSDITPDSKEKKSKLIRPEKPLVIAEDSDDIPREQDHSCFHKGDSSKKSPSKKHRTSNEDDNSDVPNDSMLDGRINELPSSVRTEERSNNKPEEKNACEPHFSGDSTKVQSRNARRKKERRHWLSGIRSENKNIESEQQPNDIPNVSTEQEDGVLNPEMQEVVPVATEPGHIHFEPPGAEESLYQSQGPMVPMESRQWNGTTNNKKGQNWGRGNTANVWNDGNGYKEQFNRNNNGIYINEGWKSNGKSIVGVWKNNENSTGEGWRKNGNRAAEGWKCNGNSGGHGWIGNRNYNNAQGWKNNGNSTGEGWKCNENSTGEGWKCNRNSTGEGWKGNRNFAAKGGKSSGNYTGYGCNNNENSTGEGWKCNENSTGEGWKNNKNSTGEGWKGNRNFAAKDGKSYGNYTGYGCNNNENSTGEGWKSIMISTTEGWKNNGNTAAGGWKNNENTAAEGWKNNRNYTGEGWKSNKNSTGEGWKGNRNFAAKGSKSSGNSTGYGWNSIENSTGEGLESNVISTTEGWKNNDNTTADVRKNNEISVVGSGKKSEESTAEGWKNIGLCATTEGAKDKGKSIVEEGKTVGDGIDFKKLFPLTCLPQVGDLLVYRIVELSSTWCPEISPHRVGKVSSYDPISMRIILVPVPEYPILLRKDTEGESSMNQAKVSSYKEDGSLEVLYPSLVDVRLLKGKANNCEESGGQEVSATVVTPVNNWDQALTSENAKETDALVVDPPVVNEPDSCWGQMKRIISEGKAQLENHNGWDEWAPNKNAASASSFRGVAMRPNPAFARAKNFRYGFKK